MKRYRGTHLPTEAGVKPIPRRRRLKANRCCICKRRFYKKSGSAVTAPRGVWDVCGPDCKQVLAVQRRRASGLDKPLPA